MGQQEVLTVLIQEGSRLLATYWRSRPIKLQDISQEIVPSSPPALASGKPSSKASGVKSGCIPCSLGHFGTCAALLNEAVRFAGKDGMGDDVSLRMNKCLDELNALERIDLQPQMLDQLTGWERQLAKQALDSSRDTRHGIEAIRNQEDLLAVAASTQTVRDQMGKEYFRHKFEDLPPEKQEEVRRKIAEVQARKEPWRQSSRYHER